MCKTVHHCRYRISSARCVFGLLLFIATSQSSHADVLFQSESRDRFPAVPFPFFFIEAEDFHDNNPLGAGASWLLSSEEESLAQTVQPDLEPDPGAFASGGESITNAIEQTTVTNNTGGGHDVQYLVQFDTPGSYYLYMRQHSPLGPDNNRNPNDSFYYPIEFGEEPTQNKANGDDYGILESIEGEGDTFQRGPWVWFAARQEVDNIEQHPLSEQRPSTFLQWNITPDVVGQTQVLEFDHRETGTLLDAFLFIDTSSSIPPTNGLGLDGMGFDGTNDLVDLVFGLRNLGSDPLMPCDVDGNTACDQADIDLINRAIHDGNQDSRFDLNSDGSVDTGDRDAFLLDVGSLPGDADLNGMNNAADLNALGTNWQSEGDLSSWEFGDFTGDRRVDAGDLNLLGIWWQKTGDDFAQAAASTAAVPEPNSISLLAGAMLLSVGFWRKRRSTRRR